MTPPPKLTDAQKLEALGIEGADDWFFQVSESIEAARDQMWVEMLAGQEPVGWEWRWFDESPYTVTSQKWSEWKRVEPRSALQTLDDAVAEFESYIASGYRYEMRALYTHPHTDDTAHRAKSEFEAVAERQALTILDDTALLQQALEMLEDNRDDVASQNKPGYMSKYYDPVVTALKARLK